jgi:hypothetical protein
VVAFALLASFFLLLSQKKETKEKATPYRLIPILLSFMGVKRKLANKIIWLKQPLAENSHETQQNRRGSRGFKVKTSLVIPAFARMTGWTFPYTTPSNRDIKEVFSKRLFEPKASFRLLPLC